MSKYNWSFFSFAHFQEGISLKEETAGSKPESTSRDDVTEATEPKAAPSHDAVVSGMPLSITSLLHPATAFPELLLFSWLHHQHPP